MRRFVQDPDRGRPKVQEIFSTEDEEVLLEAPASASTIASLATAPEGSSTGNEPADGQLSEADGSTPELGPIATAVAKLKAERKARKPKADNGLTVDVVLSDMSAPWEQTTGFWKRSLSDPYIRMMNTSGIPFKDHAGSMVCFQSCSFHF